MKELDWMMIGLFIYITGLILMWVVGYLWGKRVAKNELEEVVIDVKTVIDDTRGWK